MENQCIYRKCKGRGLRCEEPSCSISPLYCRSHRRFACELQVLIHHGLEDTPQLTQTSWVSYVHKLLTLGTSTTTIEESLCYLLTAYDMWGFGNILCNIHVGMKKNDIARHMVSYGQKLQQISSSPRKLAALTILQKRWRHRFISTFAHLRGPWPTAPCVNETDPFTLENITDLQPHTVFSFIDDDSNVFAFHAPELECAVRQGQLVNPFTRKAIPTHDIERLQHLMRYLPKKVLPYAPDTWGNAMNAFQDVCGEYQRLFGIYMQPEWFTCLVEDDVEYIFYTYHVRTHQTSRHMSVSLLHRPPCKPWGEHLYVLAHEMWRMSQDHANPYHMLWMCMLLVTIAEVSHEMTLPDWIFSIA